MNVDVFYRYINSVKNFLKGERWELRVYQAQHMVQLRGRVHLNGDRRRVEYVDSNLG